MENYSNYSAEEAKKLHNLWKRVVGKLRVEFPVLEKFNMYGFINGEDEKLYCTKATQHVDGWVKMTEFTIFGLKYPFEDAQKKSVKAFVEEVKATANYAYYKSEYMVDAEHLKEIRKYAESFGLELMDNSHKIKKSIVVRVNDRIMNFKSTTLVADKLYIEKFAESKDKECAA